MVAFFCKSGKVGRSILIATFVGPIITFIIIPAVKAEMYKWTDSNGVTYFSVHPPGKSSSESKTKGSFSNDHIVMYSTSWCLYCKKARNYFRENDILYTDYDVEELPSRMREFKDLGGTGYPLILIGQHKKMQGFSIKGFERRYYQNN
jgi:glutaredoxin